MAWLTSKDEVDPAKAKSKLVKHIAKHAKAKKEKVSARRINADDLVGNARRAGITVPQLTEALKAKGFREVHDEHGYGWEPGAEDDSGESA